MADSKGGLIGLIADEDTISGFLLAGVGNSDVRKRTNYLVVDASANPVLIETTTRQIEAAFKEFTQRSDIGVVLISQYIANMIRQAVSAYKKPFPAILEIPSKDCPYDPTQDSILSRVQFMFGAQ